MSISITGMNAARSQLDIASQNLTNSETNGYKSFRAILGDVYAQAGTASVDMAGSLCWQPGRSLPRDS